MFYLTEAENIYDQRTRKYFEEVLKNYSCKSYRSALVSLYSVAICDIIYKLEELSEEYNDERAEKILRNMRKEMEDNYNLSQWENKLVEEVFNKNIISNNNLKTYLGTLKNFRNLSAHPSLNDNFELYEPDRDMTISLINNILSDLLTKSPLLNKKIIDKLTNELAENKYWLLENEENLRDFLVKRYYSKMDLTTIKYVFKTLCRFCFVSDSKECLENLDINLSALECLLNYNYFGILIYIENEQVLTQVGNKESQKLNLCKFLFDFPFLYEYINENLKTEIKSFSKNNEKARLYSSFMYNSKQEHLEELLKQKIIFPGQVDIIKIYNVYDEEGLGYKLLDVFIEKFGQSKTFDEADNLFYKLIEPFIEKFNGEQFIEIIRNINDNDQIYRRRKSALDNTKIVKEIKFRLEDQVDFTEYPNFEYDMKAFSNNDEMQFLF